MDFVLQSKERWVDVDSFRGYKDTKFSGEIVELFMAANLHDIGKITTPLEILEKPGSLTNEELKVMRCCGS